MSDKVQIFFVAVKYPESLSHHIVDNYVRAAMRNHEKLVLKEHGPSASYFDGLSKSSNPQFHVRNIGEFDFKKPGVKDEVLRESVQMISTSKKALDEFWEEFKK